MLSYFFTGGLVENRILTNHEIITYSKLPTLDLVLGQTVGILNMAASKTHSLLNSHQQTLLYNLTELAKGEPDAEQSMPTSESWVKLWIGETALLCFKMYNLKVYYPVPYIFFFFFFFINFLTIINCIRTHT